MTKTDHATANAWCMFIGAWLEQGPIGLRADGLKYWVALANNLYRRKPIT
jgi:hypothetical protein